MLSGKQIAEARKRKGLTQEALAAELGVSRQTIAKWEQEISIPSVTNAHRLIPYAVEPPCTARYARRCERGLVAYRFG